MTQEEKEFLLQDLCSRLPYGVKCQFEDTIEVIKEIWFCEDEGWQVDGEKTSTCIHAVKPYLFPMSSMTEEQSKIYHELVGGMFGTGVLINLDCLIVFLNRNHLDWRGLIPMGLALDATGLGIYE